MFVSFFEIILDYSRKNLVKIDFEVRVHEFGECLKMGFGIAVDYDCMGMDGEGRRRKWKDEN